MIDFVPRGLNGSNVLAGILLRGRDLSCFSMNECSFVL